MTRFVARVLSVCAVVLVAAAPAAADEFYVVFNNQPLFFNQQQDGPGSTGDPYTDEGPMFPGTYTVVHYATATSNPGFPSFIDLSVSGVVPTSAAGNGFFMIGSIFDRQESEHLMMSRNPNGPPPNGLNDAFEGALLDGLDSFGALGEGLSTPGGSAIVSADDFWYHFANQTEGEFNASDFFDVVDPFNAANVGWNPADVLSDSGEGSSSILTFTPGVFSGTFTITPQGGTWDPVPEPASIALLALAGAAFAWRRRRRRS